jgi:WD40 repeat protein
LFSTESGDNYFAIIINDGYLESILSPHRVPNADSSNSIQFYDRFQRLFPYPRTRINDGNWHKLEFMMLGDSVGSFVLDDDFSTKIRFPMNYWSEESAIVFGNNLDIQRDLKRKDLTGSFRGCIRNIVINNRLIDWTNKGSLVNIEAGCYHYKLAPNQIFFLQLDQEDLESSSNIQLNGDGCVKYQSSKSNNLNDKETIEFLFKSNGDRMVMLDSMGSDFLIHLQGPGLTIRNKDDTFSTTLIERGIDFNDGHLHKFKLEKQNDKIEIELDNKYKTEYKLSKQRSQLGPFYLGCTRDSKLKTRLMELKDFKGNFLNVVYSKIDLVDALNDGEQSTLTDGQILWNTGGTSRTISSGNRNGNDESTVMLSEANSFLKLDKIDFDSNSNISFSFKTNENDGLLAFISPSDRQSNVLLTNFMAVELVDGAVSLLVNFGTQQQFKRLSCSPTQPPTALKLNDNKWHSIQIRREQRLGVDNTATITLGCDNNYVRMKLPELPKFPLTIVSMGNISGSSYLPNELWLSKNSKFIGCVRDFKINKKPIDLYKETSVESRATLSKGCKDNYILSQKSTTCDTSKITGSEYTLSFNGSQGISYALNDYVKSSSESVSLRFKTRVRNGMLFGLKKSENEPSFIVSLEDGRIKIVYDREINDKVIYIGEPNLFNNNKWHTVQIRRYGANVFGEVIDSDKTKYNIVDDLDSSLFSNLIYRFIEIGQINSLSLTQEHPSFIGWIQNVKLNCDELLNYYLNLNDQLMPNRPGIITGSALVGGGGTDQSLLLHHQITFTGSCSINLPRASTSNEQRFNIHLFFKSAQSGVLFFRRGKDTRFMALELSDGVLRFVFELGGGLKVLESDRLTSLSDRKWHEITIKRFDRQKFSMKIDDYKELLIDIGSNSPPLHELDASFVIGGLLEADQQHNKLVKENLGNKGFIGCIASLEINNDAPNLYSNMLSVCPSVQHGCIDSVCLPNPCSNNGRCSLDSNQVSCDCSITSYQGQFCRDDSLFHFFGGQSKKCGMIRYRIEQPVQDQVQDKLGFGFTTTNLEAELVRIESVDQKQYIDIKLKEGIIVLEIKLNNNEVDSKNYLPSTGERFNDNKYHVLQLIRNKNNVKFRIDNFEQLDFNLGGGDETDFIFHNQFYVYVGANQDARSGDLLNCYYGIISGMILNGHIVLDRGTSVGDVIISGSKYVTTEIEGSRSISLLPDGLCPLGYMKTNNLCLFTGCPLYSDFLGDYTCRCYYSYYHISNGINECRKINDTVSKSSILGSSAKLIPARTKLAEAPIGLILGIISGIALALLAAAIGARKCADGLCVPAPAAPKPKSKTIGGAVSQVITGTATTTNDSYSSSMTNKRTEEQQIPLIQKSSEHYAVQSDEYYKDTLDFGYRDRYALIPPAPIFTQINETTEMFEQTSAGGGITTTIIPTTVTTTTYTAGGGGAASSSLSQSAHHSSSHRNLAMDSLFYTQNNSSDYELSNVTCVTMTPNGKYAIIGQSNGTPQIWDTISGQLIRSMSGVCTNCSNLTLACNGAFLVGLANDNSIQQQQQQQEQQHHTQSLQIWEVQTGKSIQMSHQIKCCVFSLSADSNSIFMAGNQRFGRGISVGILDLVTNELTKEIKSDPTISFGEMPDSIVITPDEKHAIVGCKSISGTNFVVFDITKSTEIAQTRSIALDADPKCIVVLNNNEVITGTRGGHLIQWNIHTCEPTISFDDPGYMQAHRSTINQISLSSDNEYLVSASSDFTAKVWNTKTKNLICILSGHRGEVSYFLYIYILIYEDLIIIFFLRLYVLLYQIMIW